MYRWTDCGHFRNKRVPVHPGILLEQVAPMDSTVLLEGETGTGIELFARAIHQQSDRSNIKPGSGILRQFL